MIKNITLSHRDARFVPEHTCVGDDPLEFAGDGHVLILRNPTGAAISPVIKGASAGVVIADGVGYVDLSAGFSVGAIQPGGAVAVNLGSVRHWLSGGVTIINGVGLIATSFADALALRTSPVVGFDLGEMFERGEAGFWAGDMTAGGV